MSSDYHEMWAKPGLAPEAHDALLAGLGESNPHHFLSQKNRPEAILCFDFVVSLRYNDAWNYRGGKE